MSWTQGVQLAEDCSEGARAFFQSHAPEGTEFACVVWDTSAPKAIYADYYKDGVFAGSKTFREKK